MKSNTLFLGLIVSFCLIGFARSDQSALLTSDLFLKEYAETKQHLVLDRAIAAVLTSSQETMQDAIITRVGLLSRLSPFYDQSYDTTILPFSPSIGLCQPKSSSSPFGSQGDEDDGRRREWALCQLKIRNAASSVTSFCALDESFSITNILGWEQQYRLNPDMVDNMLRQCISAASVSTLEKQIAASNDFRNRILKKPLFCFHSYNDFANRNSAPFPEIKRLVIQARNDITRSDDVFSIVFALVKKASRIHAPTSPEALPCYLHDKAAVLALSEPLVSNSAESIPLLKAYAMFCMEAKRILESFSQGDLDIDQDDVALQEELRTEAMNAKNHFEELLKRRLPELAVSGVLNDQESLSIRSRVWPEQQFGQ